MDALTTAPIPSSTTSIGLAQGVFDSADKFELAQRIANCLVSSTMVPERFRGKENLGNAMIALDIAARINMPPIMVMQHLYVVYGTPSWSGQMVAALVNRSGLFKGLVEYEMKGVKGTDEWGCRCVATTKDGVKVFGPWVDIAMSKADGWYDRKDRDGKYCSKWRTIPEMMLRYRAVAYFGRTVCPDVTIGLRMSDEEEELAPGQTFDLKPVNPALNDEQIPSGTPVLEASGPATDIVPPRRVRKAKVVPTKEPEVAQPAPADEPAAEATPPAAEPTPQPPVTEPQPPAASVPQTIGDMANQIGVKLMEASISVDDFFDWIKNSGRSQTYRCDPDSLTEISELPSKLLSDLLAGDIEKCIKVMAPRDAVQQGK